MGYAKSQEEAGYNYEVPDNPLVIQRPDSSSQSQAEPQSPGGGGGGSNNCTPSPHAGSDDSSGDAVNETKPSPHYFQQQYPHAKPGKGKKPRK